MEIERVWIGGGLIWGNSFSKTNLANPSYAFFQSRKLIITSFVLSMYVQIQKNRVRNSVLLQKFENRDSLVPRDVFF